MNMTTIYLICGIAFVVTLVVAIFIGKFLFGKKDVNEPMQFQN